MNRLKQLYEKLGLNKENGLFLYEEANEWVHEFPYRISRILKEVIKPSAFYCIYNEESDDSDHPKPFNQSFILFFDRPSTQEEELIHKRVINFGLALVVFINREDTLDLFHGNDFTIGDIKQLKRLKREKSLDDFKEFSFVNMLLGNSLKQLGVKQDKVDRYLLGNITDARRILVAKDGLNLSSHIANRLIGRLLFVSYLIDRDVKFSDQTIISGDNKFERKKAFKNIISDKTSLYQFFQYLNDKYNGDMFPLKEESGAEIIYNEEAEVESKHLEVLYHLFNCSQIFQTGGKSKYNGYSVQESLFDLYDFEIIPVELISSIYENFIGNEFENENLQLSKQKEVKAYYTPPYLVDYVLSQTITPFLEEATKTDSNCKVLDPACGSGIFLVETLRKIIEKELSASGKKKISDTKLWQLVKSNIYGIDIDKNAIDISIFSLYVTILDYKQPAEIENFKFHKLKDENLFGGLDADFFNLQHPFNEKIKALDFIVGNPPWGEVEKSRYLEYIKNRASSEKEKNKGYVPLQIGDKEICQAFLVRVSDFMSDKRAPKCSFIVSSKVLYNTTNPSKAFRNYFLRKFHIKQVVELSPVNNKIRGGNHIFDGARQPAAIITFTPAEEDDYTGNNVIQHITIKPNRFFLYYKTIVIEKHDVKRIKQEYFIEDYGGNDWLWKVLVHGNILDVHFIRRIKDSYASIQEHLDEQGYEWKGGLKIKDGDKKIAATDILSYDYMDAEKDFRPYIIVPNKKMQRHLRLNNVLDNCIGYLPDTKFFEGDKLLVKKGLVLEPQDGDHYFGAVSAFNDKKICFSSTVCSVVPISEKAENPKSFLSTLSGVINSKLFSYYLLNSSSSAGIERTRVHFSEFFDFPLTLNPEIGDTALQVPERISEFGDKLETRKLKSSINEMVNKEYKLTLEEVDLVNYALEVAIPILLRETGSDIFNAFSLKNESDVDQLKEYINIVCGFFNRRFKSIEKFIHGEVLLNEYFIRINFHLRDQQEDAEMKKVGNDDWNLLLGDLGIYKACKDLYFQQDVRGFTNSSFYIIKPNEKKLWHRAVAHLDVMEINDQILKSELRNSKREILDDRS